MSRALLLSVLFVAGPLLLAGPSGTALADPAPAGHMCLRSMDIERTSTPDNRTILFHMKGGKVWKNTLMGACSGIQFNGFIYDASPMGEICGNQQTIRVIHTGSVCLLGPFTPAP